MMPFLFLAAAQQLRTANESITQIGIGGIFALMVIREVFSFIKSRKEVPTNGYQKSATCNEIVKRFDKNFESQDKRFDKVDVQLDEVKTLIVKKQNGN